MKLIFALLISTIASSANSQTLEPLFKQRTKAQELVPGRVLIKLKELGAEHVQNLDKASHRTRLKNILSTIEADTSFRIGFERASILGWSLIDVSLDGSLPNESQTRSIARGLAKHKAVAAARVDRVRHGLRTPNDPSFVDEWHLSIMNAEAAWDLSVGSSQSVIAIVDSGGSPFHEDLTGKEVGGFDFVSDVEEALDGDGRDADYEESSVVCPNGTDSNYHGAHVAGSAAGETNNGVGMAGVDWNARLLIVRALGGCISGIDSDIGEAIAWSAGLSVPGVPNNNTPANVINLSLGSAGTCGAFYEDVTNAVSDLGVIMVAAAGNDGNNTPVGSPANCEEIISVGAYDASGGLAPYSNFDSSLDVVAPGGNLQQGDSFGVLSACGFNSSCYTFLQGTSMASPHVAGAISLAQSLAPNATRRQILDAFEAMNVTCEGCGAVPALELHLFLQAFERGLPDESPVPDNTDAFFGQSSCEDDFLCDQNQDCLVFTAAAQNQAVTECFELCQNNADCGPSHECVVIEFSDDTADSYCVRQDDPLQVEEGAACDERRGNFDCPNGQGCVDGTCERGADDGAGAGELCDDDDDCSGGLCDRGVCTKPCDFNCDAGYECLENAIPGGMCRAESCADDPEICGAGFQCVFTSAERNVCASESASGCSQSKTPASLLSLLFFLVIIRRRCFL